MDRQRQESRRENGRRRKTDEKMGRDIRQTEKEEEEKQERQRRRKGKGNGQRQMDREGWNGDCERQRRAKEKGEE